MSYDVLLYSICGRPKVAASRAGALTWFARSAPKSRLHSAQAITFQANSRHTPHSRSVLKGHRRSQIITQATAITSSSVQTILAAQTGFYTDITNLIITTTSVNASTPFTVSITDGTNTYLFDLNPDQAVGSNTISIPFNPPLPAASSGHIWQQTNSSATPTTHTTVVAVKQAANF